MYSEEELEEIDNRLKKVADEIRQEEKIFWEQEYPCKTKEDKISHWASKMFRSMRTQTEIGQDPYDLYKNDWLKEVLKVEPNFISFLPEIFKVWTNVWDTEKVQNKINLMRKELDNT